MGYELNLPLWLHLSIHFIMAVLSGYLIGWHFKKANIGIIAGILGGFLIDLDHVLEYFFVFGLKFNLASFFDGYQFLTSDKIWLIFHGYEYVPLLLLLAFIFRTKKAVMVFLLSLTFAGFVHLVSDSVINNFPPKNYSIIYRATKNFSAPELLNDSQWEKNLKLKRELNI